MPRFLTLLLLLTTLPALAQTPDTLTEKDIRQFYQDSVAALHKPLAAYAAYVRQKMHDDYSAMISLNTGQTVTVTKQDLLNTAQETLDSARTAKIGVRLDGIEIAEDGQSAFVRSRTDSAGMTFPLPDGRGTLTIDVGQVCNDYIVLTPGAGMQAMQSECEQTLLPARR